jgi:succinoglycan biosynthesis protein ExoM
MGAASMSAPTHCCGPAVAVCIVTFRRPDLLAGLLDSLSQDLPVEDIDGRIVVVDNDPQGSAAPVIAARRAMLTVPLQYVRETRPGVSFARNTAIVAAGAVDFIAFIDDDMRPLRGWLKALLDRQRATGAAAVTGPIEPHFERPPPQWLREAFHLCYVRGNPDGSVSSASAGNLLLDRRALAAARLSFSDEFSLIGGEDTQFAADLQAAGLRVTWAVDALVTEYIPASRMSADWLSRRWFRYGIIDAEVDRRRRPGPSGRGRALWRGLLRIGGGALLMVPALVAVAGGRRSAPIRRVYTLARGCGMIVGALGVTPLTPWPR